MCPKAESVVKQFMDEWKPKHRVHLGDVWDFRALRQGASPEERAEDVRYDYNCGKELLGWFKPQILTLGNHDHRIWRTARETSNGALADLMSKFCDEAETDLRKMKIQVTPWGVENYAKLPIIGSPKLLHGYRATMYPAKAHFENYGDCITAHVHKPDSHEARNVDGGKAYCVGTLARIKEMGYANAWAAKLAWRNSFLYGMHNTKTGKWKAWDVVKEGEEWVSPIGVLKP